VGKTSKSPVTFKFFTANSLIAAINFSLPAVSG